MDGETARGEGSPRSGIRERKRPVTVFINVSRVPYQVRFCRFKILKRNKQSLLGASAYRASAPAARASPKIAIAPQKADEKLPNKGGQRDAPLGLLPPLEERGGPPHSCRRYTRTIRKIGFQQNQEINKKEDQKISITTSMTPVRIVSTIATGATLRTTSPSMPSLSTTAAALMIFATATPEAIPPATACAA